MCIRDSTRARSVSCAIVWLDLCSNRSIRPFRSPELPCLGSSVLTSDTEAGGLCEGGMLLLAMSMPLLLMEVVVLSLIHISEHTRHLRISYAVFCLKKKRI